MEKPNITRYAWLSIVAAIFTIALKSSAYFLTGSVGLLSDALESLVNLAAALMALFTIPAGPLAGFLYAFNPRAPFLLGMGLQVLVLGLILSFRSAHQSYSPTAQLIAHE